MLVRYFYLGITFITLTCGSIHAQDRDFGVLNRYAQENKNITISAKPVKVVFMGNSITEGWVNCHPAFFTDNGYVGRPLNSCYAFGKMSLSYLPYWLSSMLEPMM